MGQLTRFRFSPEFIDRFPVFIETGTGKGFSLSYAADVGFRLLFSIEYDERLYDAARQRFSDNAKVSIHGGESPAVLSRIVRLSHAGMCFWLDAHSPGSDYFGEAYDSVQDRRLRQPLPDELAAIRARRPDGDYVVIIDDWRIYEDGEWEHGNLPAKARGLAADERSTEFLEPFRGSHDIIRNTHDAGYLILVPKGCPVRPEPIEFGLEELVAIARRDVEVNDLVSARIEYTKVLQATQPIEPPHIGAKILARGEACAFMGAFALGENRDLEALQWFTDASHTDPQAIEYRLHMIYHILHPMGWLDHARRQAQIVTRIQPDNPQGWRALAETERRAGNVDAMGEAIDRASAINPDDPDTRRLMAGICQDCGEFEEATQLYSDLGAVPERRAGALFGLAMTRYRAGEFETALGHIDEALALGLGPDEALAIWNRAEILLTLGRYAEGWADQGRRFELERKMAVGPAGSRFKRPLWNGPDDAEARYIHVHTEQGYGDAICMARYVPLLAALGHRVQFEVEDEFVELFRSSFETDLVKVVPRALDFPGAWGLDQSIDCHVPAMCFPAMFGTDIDTVPWSGPYLKPDPALVERYNYVAGGIGLCWGAGARPGLWYAEYARRKSVPFHELGPLMWKLGRRAVALQVGAPLAEIGGSPLRRPLGDKPTWADTAAVIANLDLVITVDTGVAHLAGAMGKPVWLMLHGPGASWHFMADIEGARWQHRSPWYPTIRLFRQKVPHEWDDVVDRIVAELP